MKHGWPGGLSILSWPNSAAQSSSYDTFETDTNGWICQRQCFFSTLFNEQLWETHGQLVFFTFVNSPSNMIFCIYFIIQRFLVIDTVEFFRKRLGTKLTWHAEPGATVNLNEIGFRKIFTQSQGGLLAIPWDLLLRRDLERLCCISGEKGKEEAIGDDFSEEQFRLTRSRKCIQNPLRRYRRKRKYGLWLEGKVPQGAVQGFGIITTAVTVVRGNLMGKEDEAQWSE